MRRTQQASGIKQALSISREHLHSYVSAQAEHMMQWTHFKTHFKTWKCKGPGCRLKHCTPHHPNIAHTGSPCACAVVLQVPAVARLSGMYEDLIGEMQALPGMYIVPAQGDWFG